MIGFGALSAEALGIILEKRCREAVAELTDEERAIVSERELCGSLLPLVSGGDGVRGVMRIVREKISEKLLEAALRR